MSRASLAVLMVTRSHQGFPVAFVLLLLVAVALYFLPTFVAFGRHHRERFPILVLNLFAGWTFVAWIIALVWSFTSNVAPTEEEGPTRLGLGGFGRRARGGD